MSHKKNSGRDIWLFCKSVLVWWVTCFLLVFLIVGFFQPGNIFRDRELLLTRAAIAFVAAVVLDFILLKIIFPRCDQGFRTMKEISLEMQRDGFSPHVVERMQDLFDFCSNKPLHVTYMNYCAIDLASYFCTFRRPDDADYYFKCINTKALGENRETITTKRQLVRYQMVKLEIACLRGNPDEMAFLKSEADECFNRYRGKDEMIDKLIASSDASYAYWTGHFADAMAYLEPYVSDVDMEFGISIMYAECCFRMGNIEESKSYYEKAVQKANNIFQNQVIEFSKKTLGLEA